MYSLKRGRSCALLGFPGTGKTMLTADIVESLLREGKKVVITGSTGASPQPLKQTLAKKGISVGVQTIHSLLCLTQSTSKLIEEGKLERLEKQMSLLLCRGYANASVDILQGCDILVIEEISMISGHFMQAIDTCLRVLQKKYSKIFRYIKPIHI